MTVEYPPPDPRLDGKVKISPFAAERGFVASSDGYRNGVQPQPDADGEIARLAKLDKLGYERERKDAAKRLGIRAPALDRLVTDERRQFDSDSKQGRPLSLPEPEPWPEPVDGAELLDALAASIRQHVVLSDHAADTAALWVLHTYLLDVFGISPRLAISETHLPQALLGRTTLRRAAFRSRLQHLRLWRELRDRSQRQGPAPRGRVAG